MSSFWSMKIGKSKQDSKEPAKKTGDKNKSYKKAPVDIVQALMERALTDAEQLVESVKTRARKEAETEVAKIVEQAKNIIAEKDISDIETTASQVIQESEPEPVETDEAEVITAESPAIEIDNAEEAQSVSEPDATEESGEEITEQVMTETEEPQAVITEEAVNEETAAVADELEAQPDAEESTDEDNESDEIEIDKEALYSEDIEIAIAVPVDPVAVSKLYNNLQMTPEIKILYTRGSWDKGTIITVNMEKPLPLMDIISSIPGIDVKVIRPQKKDSIKGTPSALLGGDKEEITRIDLQMKAR